MSNKNLNYSHEKYFAHVLKNAPAAVLPMVAAHSDPSTPRGMAFIQNGKCTYASNPAFRKATEERLKQRQQSRYRRPSIDICNSVEITDTRRFDVLNVLQMCAGVEEVAHCVAAWLIWGDRCTIRKAYVNADGSGLADIIDPPDAEPYERLAVYRIGLQAQNRFRLKRGLPMRNTDDEDNCDEVKARRVLGELTQGEQCQAAYLTNAICDEFQKDFERIARSMLVNDGFLELWELKALRRMRWPQPAAARAAMGWY